MKSNILVALLACALVCVCGDVTCRLATFELEPDPDYTFSGEILTYDIINVYEWDVTTNAKLTLFYNQSNGCTFRPTSAFLNYTMMVTAFDPCSDVNNIFPAANGIVIDLTQPAPQTNIFCAGANAITNVVTAEGGNGTWFFWEYDNAVVYTEGFPKNGETAQGRVNDVYASFTYPVSGTSTSNLNFHYHLIGGPRLAVLETWRVSGLSFVLAFDTMNDRPSHLISNTTVHGLPTNMKAVVRAYMTDNTTGALTILAKDSENGTLSVYTVPQTTDSAVAVTATIEGVSFPEYYVIMAAYNNGTTWFAVGSDLPSPGPKDAMNLVLLMIANDGSWTSTSQITKLPVGVGLLDAICA